MERDELLLGGDDLLSHVPADAVSSALVGLTSGFGMEPGGAPPRQSPAKSSSPVIQMTRRSRPTVRKWGTLRCYVNEALGR